MENSDLLRIFSECITNSEKKKKGQLILERLSSQVLMSYHRSKCG